MMCLLGFTFIYKKPYLKKKKGHIAIQFSKIKFTSGELHVLEERLLKQALLAWTFLMKPSHCFETRCSSMQRVVFLMASIL